MGEPLIYHALLFIVSYLVCNSKTDLVAKNKNEKTLQQVEAQYVLIHQRWPPRQRDREFLQWQRERRGGERKASQNQTDLMWTDATRWNSRQV